MSRWVKLTFVALVLTQAASASNENRLRLTGGLVASSFTGPGGSAVGTGPTLGVNYLLSERYSIGAGFGQTFALSNGISPMFSRFEIVLTAALTGRLKSEGAAFTVNDRPFFQSINHVSEGLRGKLKANQYFFTGSAAVYPYAGFGLELGYEWRGLSGLGYEISIGADWISNTVTTSFPLNASFVVVLWP